MCMEEKEVWKDIEGYEGLYQVSNFGRVKSLNYHQTGKEGLKQTKKNRCGYLFVQLFKNSHKKNLTVHRLVGAAFIPNPENLPCINHKDCNRTNNNVSNLEWCTYEYNTNYGDCIKKRIETKNKRGVIGAEKKVVQVSLDNVPIKIWSNIKKTESIGTDASRVSKCCRGIKKSHRGYKWLFFLPPALPLK